MNIQEQKKYHERKLVIIDMIESCDYFIESEERNLADFGYMFAMENSKKNIAKYTKIKKYLLTRYNN